MAFTGRWRFTEMDLWDQEAFELVGPAYILFDNRGQGELSFIAVLGELDCREGQRGGWPLVEFSWEGSDERDPICGRGWVTFQDDDTLTGHIFIHNGDDSSVKAKRWTDLRRD